MIRVVTIEREYGCGGGDIAELLANQLGWKLWDQLLTDEIAKAVNCPRSVVEAREERDDPLYYRLFKSFLRGSYEGSINAPKLNLVDSETIIRVTRRIIGQATDAGNCVIVGRGSQQFLRARADTLRVFLYGNRADKIARLLARDKSKNEAEELIDTVDKGRADFIRKYFKVEWPDYAIYHVMVDTGIGHKAVLRVITECLEALNLENQPSHA